jgi:FAD dependent oxidoreductase
MTLIRRVTISLEGSVIASCLILVSCCLPSTRGPVPTVRTKRVQLLETNKEMTSSETATAPPPRQHGVKGVYYGGDWLDVEDCDGRFTNLRSCSGACDDRLLARAANSHGGGTGSPLPPCPRSRTRHTAAKNRRNDSHRSGGGSNGSTTHPNPTSASAAADGGPDSYDVVIIGAGCVGACLARELARYSLSVLWLEAADDVSQGSSKGNSGIVHAGYDDNPQSVRAKYCWRGNQMYAQLDRELRFGYQKNGSLVLAFNDAERSELTNLMQRGQTNGVQKLRIVEKEELLKMEPHVNPTAVAALHAPEAGNVIPYEFTIALAENAVDNGIELRLRRVVTDISYDASSGQFTISSDHWEPAEYVRSVQQSQSFTATFGINDAIMYGMGFLVVAHYVVAKYELAPSLTLLRDATLHFGLLASIVAFAKLHRYLLAPTNVSKDTPLEDLVAEAGLPEGGGGGNTKSTSSGPVSVQDMLVGGSGSSHAVQGQVVEKEVVKCRFVLNCAGGAADQIARMIGDNSFHIKPRLGDYILLNRNQVRFSKTVVRPRRIYCCACSSP